MKKHDKVFTCNVCEKTYTSHVSLWRHKKSIHRENALKYDRCHMTYANQETLDRHMKTHDMPKVQKSYECEFCKEIFNCTTNRKRHIEAHHDNITYPCKLCDKVFLYKNTHAEHMDSAHCDEKKYPCPKCDMTFSMRGSRWIHIKTTHDERRFKCDPCQKVYKGKQRLKGHMENHWKFPIKYNCTMCAKVCITKSQFDFHVYAYHSEHVNCESCTNEFLSKGRLRAHSLKSKVCSIDDCMMEFGCVFLRRKHENEDHVHECLICIKTFKGEKSLKSHIKIQHEKVSCASCNKIHTGISGLRSHMLTQILFRVTCARSESLAIKNCTTKMSTRSADFARKHLMTLNRRLLVRSLTRKMKSI